MERTFLNAKLFMGVYHSESQPLDKFNMDSVPGIHIVEKHVIRSGTLIKPEAAFSQEPSGVLQNPISTQQPDRTYALLYRTSTKDRSGFPTNNNSEWDI